MRQIILLLGFNCICFLSFAEKISGTITDDKGKPLSYASVFIKGTSRGTTANSEGKYFLNLEPGTYTIICQHVGYTREERKITVAGEAIVLNFQLKLQELTMGEVVVKRGEDPAYEIIRKAIKKRPYYNSQVDSFSVDVYIKGLLRSRGIPNKVFGQKIERDGFEKSGLDSAGKGILFLSESLTKVYYAEPNKIKYEVISSRQSGGMGGGISFPFFINFYENNVQVFGTAISQRGFISPIANGALNYYRYKFEGSFYEDGKEINRIKVTPKRKHEPLFTGYIQITEGDWRIHSIDLLTTPEYQLEMIDTVRISQIHVPVAEDIWKTKDQVVYVAVKKLGFDFAGNFVNVYTNYNVTPHFKRKFFDRVFMKYDTGYAKKDTAYWSNIRPLPLEREEMRDFIFKDSVAKADRDSFLTRRSIDSLNKNQKSMSIRGVLMTGDRRMFYGKKSTTTYTVKGLIPALEYNTVEGLAINVYQRLYYRPMKRKYTYSLGWSNRYGISNQHYNSTGELVIAKKSTSFFQDNYLRFSGGKRVSQFNHDNPINHFTNSVFTLLYKRNYMKIYENWFGAAELNKIFDNGFKLNVQATYENRIPLENTTNFVVFKSNRVFTPNHPEELASIPFERHQALVAAAVISYQPGQRYIEYPGRKIPIGSKYPTFELQYSKGFKDLLGSDVDFDKWKFSISDKMNFKMGGEFRYKFSIGGFINDNSVGIPDMQHFNGNRTFYNHKYLNSFQLAPYYRYSNTENFYALAHVEHHFNGLLTNKLPLFNKLKWNLVVGSNTFYVNKNNYYVEGFVGIENIFKLFRVDFATGWQPDLGNTYGVRIGFGGLIGKGIKKEGDRIEISF